MMVPTFSCVAGTNIDGDSLQSARREPLCLACPAGPGQIGVSLEARTRLIGSRSDDRGAVVMDDAPAAFVSLEDVRGLHLRSRNALVGAAGDVLSADDPR